MNSELSDPTPGVVLQIVLQLIPEDWRGKEAKDKETEITT
jgi:hypothetical protein